MVEVVDRLAFERHVALALNKAYVIPVGRACNARCVFCATTVYEPRPVADVASIQALLRGVRLLVDAGVDRLEITGGGEPTLHREIHELVAGIREVSASVYIKLYTNGIRVDDIPAVDEVNVSRAAWDSERNQPLMMLHHRGLELPELAVTLRKRGIKNLRLSVPLIRGGVDGAAELRWLLEAATGHFDVVVFRPLYPATPDKAALECEMSPAEWSHITKRCQVDFPNIVVQLDDVGCFRAAQLILASDSNTYCDWGLRNYVPGTSK